MIRAQSIYTVHMVDERFDGAQYVASTMTQYLATIRWLRLSLQRLPLFLTVSRFSSTKEKS